MAVVISGFPGIGKSRFFKNNSSISVSDSDSSQFAKEDFPENYIRHIVNLLDVKNIIMVSSHKIVREALEKVGIKYFLVYPDRSLKEEYLSRYRERGSGDFFVGFVSTNWGAWIDEMEQSTYPTKIALQAGEFLSDIAPAIFATHLKVECGHE